LILGRFYHIDALWKKFNHGIHIFRHSAITMLYRLTEDLKRAQGFARHSRISTTADTYMHSDPVESESTEMIAANITSADLLSERESVVHLWYKPAIWCNNKGQPQ
jgi:integrase